MRASAGSETREKGHRGSKATQMSQSLSVVGTLHVIVSNAVLQLGEWRREEALEELARGMVNREAAERDETGAAAGARTEADSFSYSEHSITAGLQDVDRAAKTGAQSLRTRPTT